MKDFYDACCSVVDPSLNDTPFYESGYFWNKENPVFEDGKVTQGGMLDHQVQWWNLDSFLKILVGGYGCGKTLILCKRAIASALENAPYPVAVISPTFSIARFTIISTIYELLSGKRSLFGKKFLWKYNASPHTFCINFRGRNGIIIIYSGDNPLSLRGPNLAAAYIDEPFIQDVEIYRQMVARVRHPLATLREIGMTGTPEQLNWGYDLCEGELGEDQSVGIVRGSTRNNPALDTGFVGRLSASLTAKAIRAYIDGEFVDLSEGLVYYGFSREASIVDDDTPPENSELGAGMDFNVNPMAATVFWRTAERIHYFDELELPNSDTEFMCSVLREKYWNQGLRFVYPDATGTQRRSNAPGGKTDFHYIKQAAFRIRAYSDNPKRRDRYNTVNGRLSPSVGKPQVTISPKCTKLRKYLSTYSYELMKKQESMSHLLDAFSYPICFLMPIISRNMKTIRVVEG